MKEICILSDFDGTITEKDGLYWFIKKYADDDWVEIEQLWEEGLISSKECLLREFSLIKNLNETLINEYIKNEIIIDKYFKNFQQFAFEKNYDIFVVSDGLDYFIEKTLKINNIQNVNIISNHFQFIDKKFDITFPYENLSCKKNAGTCKCIVLEKMKKIYNKIIYIGDGTSDYCVCDKADILFAKTKLAQFCFKNNIECIEFKTFNDIIKKLNNT